LLVAALHHQCRLRNDAFRPDSDNIAHSNGEYFPTLRICPRALREAPGRTKAAAFSSAQRVDLARAELAGGSQLSPLAATPSITTLDPGQVAIANEEHSAHEPYALLDVGRPTCREPRHSTPRWLRSASCNSLSIECCSGDQMWSQSTVGPQPGTQHRRGAHILYPVDFSEASQHAIEHALAIARWSGAAVSALHVCHPMLVP
jgi:hypothetical protein